MVIHQCGCTNKERGDEKLTPAVVFDIATGARVVSEAGSGLAKLFAAIPSEVPPFLSEFLDGAMKAVTFSKVVVDGARVMCGCKDGKVVRLTMNNRLGT
jgi:hypothetical protein